MSTLLNHNPVPRTGPRNLTVPLATWLRGLGFTVVERGGLAPDSLTATWVHGSECFILTYQRFPQAGCLRLICDQGRPGSYPHTLLDWCEVNRLREARCLLLSVSAYRLARAAALLAGELQPTTARSGLTV